MNLFLGIDFGTSGARAIVIDNLKQVHTEVKASYPQVKSLTNAWQETLFSLLYSLPQTIRQKIKRIAIDGTSSTVLICDKQGNAITQPLLYNDSRAQDFIPHIQTFAPENHTVISATSSLVKLLYFLNQDTQDSYFLHQADWLAFLLHGKLGFSDYHNALKLGYDVENLCYPDWLLSQNFSVQLPQVLLPGEVIGEIKSELVKTLDFPDDCLICAGTTDSIAAFLASGANSPGDAVTSLGSTLVLKLLSRTKIDDAKYGIYSHRFGDLWLVGGASNTGGAVLKHFFSDEELAEFSQQINPQIPSPLEYYPLLRPGDRFPINDPHLPPNLSPRPENPVEFLHGLLESIARIESQGYNLLQSLGSNPLQRVYTAGGGAKNPSWSAIRHRLLKVPLVDPLSGEAAFGSAVLAMGGS